MPDRRAAVVLQPSFLPWRGVFDLVARADVFVFYDDVQYDKHGWRNRNRIKTAQGPQWITVPVHAKGNVTTHLQIDRVRIDNRTDWRRSHLERIRHAYRRAPFFESTFPFVEEIYAFETELLAELTIAQTKALADRLGLRRPDYVRGSDLAIEGTKTEKLVATLRAVEATSYISGPAARAYIENERFRAADIELGYIGYAFPEYPQLHGPYDGNLSILDLLFMTGDRAADYLIGSEVTAA
jgi:hypothetical protein